MASMSVFFFFFFFPFFDGRGFDVRAGVLLVPFERVVEDHDLHRVGLRWRSRFLPVRNVIASVVM